MDLSAKFRMTSSCQTVRITSLNTDISYPIERAEKLQSRYGEAVLLTLRESSQVHVKVFTKTIRVLFSEDDLKSINRKNCISSSQIPGHLLRIKFVYFRDYYTLQKATDNNNRLNNVNRFYIKEPILCAHGNGFNIYL